MANSLERGGIRVQIERAGREIATMRRERLPSAAANELAKLEERHGDLHRRLADLEARGQPENHIASALATDFDGLVQSISRWITRQDTKAARR